MKKMIAFITVMAMVLYPPSCGEPEVTERVHNVSAAPAVQVAESSAEEAPDLTQCEFELALTGETVTYEELHQRGFANLTPEGVYYALVDASAGAGSQFFDVWSTVSGEWEMTDKMSLPNGYISFFAMNDGRLMEFQFGSAYCEQYPWLKMFTLVNGRIVVTEYRDALASRFAETHDCSEYAVYSDGNYNFYITAESRGERASISGMMTIDPETLMVVK